MTNPQPAASPLASGLATPHAPQANPWGVFGHDHAVEALRRVIREGNLSHAYLVSGPDGVGKATLVRRLAQTLVSPSAEDPTVPDLTTRASRQLEAGELADIERIAIGGVCDESNHDHVKDNSTRIRICQVRRIERVAFLAPFAAPRRIFVIDTANNLQPEAAHALLKTLEEPPPGVLIVLLATDVDDLLPTIRSRCQHIPLRPMSFAALQAALEMDPEIADPAGLARLAHGRYGLARRMHADPSLGVLRESVTNDVR
ncbi:MAG: AAA family ATPase, partial [Dehalococcoidia bacterium]